MDVATALTVAQTLFATLQCAEVRKLCSTFNYESELQKLLDTVKIIKNCLLDADSKWQELTNGGQYWVQNLKDAVYDADDLLDEFNTIAHQLDRMPGGKVMKKVRRFFSSKNQLVFAVNMSREVKKLREKLDSLAKNHSDFGFSDLYKPVKSREETCSYVYEQDIIGRDVDKVAIVDLLLQDDLENNISFVTIVGIGGLGKTALAQLVFSDNRIKEAFKENMYWVCVSLNFDMKAILGKMIRKKELEFQDLQTNVRNRIEGERYLLVLDDVWCENGRKWDELRNFLILGGRGTRILVTSRSRKVAGAIGNYPIHELRGLSVEDSWVLFKKISLGQREDEAVTGLVEIGKEIVRKCANVPLSIRVIASLLRNQDIATWQSFKSNDLADMCASEDGIMPTLMFSYYHLAPELKSCFSFCSLFPEDHVITKELLISLWMAQGYLVPSAKTESMEDVGERYISILMHRCFFQDIKECSDGKVYSFKMHDLIHDLARKVAAKESLTLTTCTNDFGGKIRHLFIESNEGLSCWFSSSNYPSKALRTCLMSSTFTHSYVDAIISNCNRLRVLKLHQWIPKSLQDSLGKLLHLRYLDLSRSDELEMLPESITKLHNLQTLKLDECYNLKELPDNISKLVNLRYLDLSKSDLEMLPESITKLHNLQTLKLVECSNLKEFPDNTSKLVNLRYLDLSRSNLEMLPESITKLHNLQTLKLVECSNLKELPNNTSKLVNLRYLDLSRSNLEMLPESITKLHNLQTLKLVECRNLKELPDNTSKLVNLRVLDIYGCQSLTHMPAGMSKLTCLHRLGKFVFREDEVKQDKKGKLIDFIALSKSLRGRLEIIHCANLSNNKPKLKCMEVILNSLNLNCKLGSPYKEGQEILLESLFFTHNFQKMRVMDYGGAKLPSWSSELVSIYLIRCNELQYLPSSVSQLCHLKYLKLHHLKNLKYIERDAPSPSAKFFPSLEILELYNMPILKGWWSDIAWMEKEAFFMPSFPQLHELHILKMERLTYFPPCPHVKDLALFNVNEALEFCMKGGVVQSYPISLNRLRINNSCVFNSLFGEFVGSVVRIELVDIKDLGTIREAFQSCTSSLQHLEVSRCRGIENLGIEHLTHLKSIKLE